SPERAVRAGRPPALHERGARRHEPDDEIDEPAREEAVTREELQLRIDSPPSRRHLHAILEARRPPGPQDRVLIATGPFTVERRTAVAPHPGDTVRVRAGRAPRAH